MIHHAGMYVGNSNVFMLSVDNSREINFIQPYFFVTSMEHPRKGNINRLDCKISGQVWAGTQRHGWGYSWSADVFGTLIEIIKTLYRNKLSEKAKRELNNINTHESDIKLSNSLLNELSRLNSEYLNEKYSVA